MYLLDTDTLVFMLRGNENVARRLKEHATDPRAMSVISYRAFAGTAKSWVAVSVGRSTSMR